MQGIKKIKNPVLFLSFRALLTRNPEKFYWIPAFVGMTLKGNLLESYRELS
jgi:hypothetical protein